MRSRWPFPERLRGQLPTIALEMASVVFAVLLALSIDQCREERARDQLVAEARRRIETEVRTNRSRLAEVIPDQEQQLAQIEAIVAALRAPASEGELGFNLTAEYLSDAAWQTALVTQAIRFMDLDRVTRLSEIYALQELVDGAFRRILDLMTSLELGVESGEFVGLRHLRAALAQLIELERQLGERYDAYLAPSPQASP